MTFLSGNYEKIKLTCIALLVISLPFYIFASSILIILCVVLQIYIDVKQKNIALRKLDWLSILLIGYFLLECIGILYTDKANLGDGFFTLEKHQALIFFPFIFLNYSIRLENRRILLLSFVASCLIACIICVIVNIQLSLSIYNRFMHEWQFSHSRLAEPIDMHPVYLAMYLSLSILIILELLRDRFFQSSVYKKLAAAVLLVGFFIMIVLLGGRTIAVGLVMIIFVNAIRYAFAERSIKFAMLSLAIPVLFIAAIFINPVVRTRFFDITKGYQSSNYGSYFARTKIWEPGMELIRENILVGVGTGDYQAELDKKFIKYNYLEGLGMNLHNQFLQTTLNFGLAGLLLWLAILAVQFAKGFTKKDFLYISFVALFIFGCLTESMLSSNKGIIFFLVFSFIFYKSETLAPAKINS